MRTRFLFLGKEIINKERENAKMYCAVFRVRGYQ